MEDYLISTLALVRGSKVLCGVGHVAIHLAKDGYCVHRIDVADHHTVKARHNIKAEGLDRKATVAKGITIISRPSQMAALIGAYTMETFVHAAEPKVAVAGFFSCYSTWRLPCHVRI